MNVNYKAASDKSNMHLIVMTFTSQNVIPDMLKLECWWKVTWREEGGTCTVRNEMFSIIYIVVG